MIEKNNRFQIAAHIVMILLCIFCLFPFLILISSSITSEMTLVREGYSILPKNIDFSAYKYLLTSSDDIIRGYIITICVTVIGTVANLTLTILLAYPLSRRDLPHRNVFAFIVFFTMLFNGGLVPSYLMWTSTFHIKNTIWALIVPNFLCGAMNIILIRTYFMTSIPEALYEAAKIDGASYLYIFRRIAVPMGVPIFVTVGLFSGLGYWNDWTNGLYYINDAKLYSIQTLLNKMIQDIQALQANATAASSGAAMQIPTVSVRMAIAFVALAPILIIYPFLQKYFAEGIAMGAVKG